MNISEEIKSLQQKQNLKALEGSVEIFVDKLEDIGVFDLKLGQTIVFGTYKNTFTAADFVKDALDEDNGVVSISTIACVFYENAEDNRIKIVTFFDGNGDMLDRLVYWFDVAKNDTPEYNSEWTNILENMDIFLDDED